MLNTKDFVVLAGNPQKWDDEIRARCRPGDSSGTFNSEDLCKVQAEQYRSGRRSMHLDRTIHGWCVRGNFGFAVVATFASKRMGNLDGSKEAAMEFGTRWANEDPDNREFIAYRRDFEGGAL